MRLSVRSFVLCVLAFFLISAESLVAVAQQTGNAVFQSPATGTIKPASRVAVPAMVPAETGQLRFQPRLYHDDPDNSTPTAWWIYSGQSPTDISNTINADNARIV